MSLIRYKLGRILAKNKAQFEKLQVSNLLARLEGLYYHSKDDFMAQQVGFCAQWLLDNICTYIKLDNFAKLKSKIVPMLVSLFHGVHVTLQLKFFLSEQCALLIRGRIQLLNVSSNCYVILVMINSRTAIAGAIIGLLLVFYNSKNSNCIGALSYFF